MALLLVRGALCAGCRVVDAGVRACHVACEEASEDRRTHCQTRRTRTRRRRKSQTMRTKWTSGDVCRAVRLHDRASYRARHANHAYPSLHAHSTSRSHQSAGSQTPNHPYPPPPPACRRDARSDGGGATLEADDDESGDCAGVGGGEVGEMVVRAAGVSEKNEAGKSEKRAAWEVGVDGVAAGWEVEVVGRERRRRWRVRGVLA